MSEWILNPNNESHLKRPTAWRKLKEAAVDMDCYIPEFLAEIEAIAVKQNTFSPRYFLACAIAHYLEIKDRPDAAAAYHRFLDRREFNASMAKLGFTAAELADKAE